MSQQRVYKERKRSRSGGGGRGDEPDVDYTKYGGVNGEISRGVDKTLSNIDATTDAVVSD